MTTKYTNEQILEYLRTLRVGDVLTAVADSDEFYTKGRLYVVEIDEDGDLYVNDNEGLTDYIRVDDTHDHCVAEYIRDGIFGIPTQAPTGHIAIDAVTRDGEREYTIRITADEAGYEAVTALEERLSKAQTLTKLKAERDALQAQIDELEATL